MLDSGFVPGFQGVYFSWGYSRIRCIQGYVPCNKNQGPPVFAKTIRHAVNTYIIDHVARSRAANITGRIKAVNG